MATRVISHEALILPGPLPKCSYPGCDADAKYRLTWYGEGHYCEPHADQVMAIAGIIKGTGPAATLQLIQGPGEVGATTSNPAFNPLQAVSASNPQFVAGTGPTAATSLVVTPLPGQIVNPSFNPNLPVSAANPYYITPVKG